MKDYPVLFTDEMVRAIHAGIKTRISRPVLPQPDDGFYQTGCHWYHPTVVDGRGIEQPGAEVFGFADEYSGWKSPFGGPGDRIVVRSSYRVSYDPSFHLASWVGPEGCGMYVQTRGVPTRKDGKPMQLGRKPAMHMPRWLSDAAWRPLPVLDVRVEWLQDITTADCVAEGMEDDHWLEYEDMASSTGGPGVRETIRDYFGQKWDAIYATKGLGFADNPLVWVGTFEVPE